MASNVNANSGNLYKNCDKCGEPMYYGTSHICESSTDMVRKAIAARDKEWVEWIEKLPYEQFDNEGFPTEIDSRASHRCYLIGHNTLQSRRKEIGL